MDKLRIYSLVKEELGVVMIFSKIHEKLGFPKLVSPSARGFDIKNIEYVDDIGTHECTVEFENILNNSKTIVWNGPLGYSELEKYSNGTKNILEYIKDDDKTVIIGGGDTAAAAINFGYKDSFTHISTGGGASLELLEGKKLPGIEVIGDN